MDKPVVVIIALTVIVFGGIVAASVSSNKNFKPRNQCVEHSVGLSMHIHPEVEIYVDGQKVPIPADLGISPGCMKAVHTHDETGKIHLEYPESHDFMLEDFFAIWGKPFNKDTLLDKSVDQSHVLTMTVNGQPNTEYEKLVLKDGQKIVIRYDQKP